MNDFKPGMVTGARYTGPSISKSHLLGFSSTTISRVYREQLEKEIPKSSSSVDRNPLLMKEENGHTGSKLTERQQ